MATLIDLSIDLSLIDHAYTNKFHYTFNCNVPQFTNYRYFCSFLKFLKIINEGHKNEPAFDIG